MALIIKSNIREAVRKFDKDKKVPNVADEVETELEKKIEEILEKGVKRAIANGRKTLQSRDL